MSFLLGDTLYLIQWIGLDSFPRFRSGAQWTSSKNTTGAALKNSKGLSLHEARGLFGYNHHATIEAMLQYFTKDVLSGNADLSEERAAMTCLLLVMIR